jgi:hypothetical protein
MIDKDSKELNSPWRTPGGTKKYAVVVKDPKTGDRRVVRFGDPKMDDYRKHKDPKRRKNFHERMNCASDPKAKDKTRPKYWSCKWSW